MKKWISYLIYLAVMITLVVLGITVTKAGFLIVEDTSLPYKPCTIEEKFTETRYHSEPIKRFPVTKEKLPKDLKWENGMEQEVFADPKAKIGGTFNAYMLTFPQTFRQIGTNSNSGFRGELDGYSDMQTIEVHPITEKIYPGIAKEWAISADKRTVYFKIDPDARWSDGVPITADDYIYMLKMLRSKGIVSPWYNEYYSVQVEDILKFDDLTYAVRLPYAKPNVVLYCALTPKPYHFYGNFRLVEHKASPKEAHMIYKRDHLEMPEELKVFSEKEELLKKVESAANDAEKNAIEEKIENLSKEIKKLTDSEKKYTLTLEDVCESWNSKYTWKVPPCAGPYQLVKYMHGKWVLFKRHDNWWASNKKFYKNRYNPQYRKLKLIADLDIAFEYFKQHELDLFSLASPRFWYKKSVGIREIDNGYMYRIQFWNDAARPTRLISMNMMNDDAPLLKNRDIRLGLAHSFNLQKMIELALLGDAKQASSITTGYGAFTNNDIKYREFDIDRAAEYFAKAGFDQLGSDGIRKNANGERLSFDLLFANKPDEPKLLLIKEEAAKAGVELKLITFDANSVFKVMLSKKHQLAWHGWAPGSRINGVDYWGQYHGDNAGKPQNNNFSNMNHPEINDMITKHRKSTDQKERHELSKKIQEVVHNEACAIPTYYVPFTRYAVWNWMKFPENVEFPLAETPFAYQTWWIDEDEKKQTIQSLKNGKKLPKQFKEYTKYKPVDKK